MHCSPMMKEVVLIARAARVPANVFVMYFDKCDRGYDLRAIAALAELLRRYKLFPCECMCVQQCLYLYFVSMKGFFLFFLSGNQERVTLCFPDVFELGVHGRSR